MLVANMGGSCQGLENCSIIYEKYRTEWGLHYGGSISMELGVSNPVSVNLSFIWNPELSEVTGSYTRVFIAHEYLCGVSVATVEIGIPVRCVK
jgi:hypothetical protein